MNVTSRYQILKSIHEEDIFHPKWGTTSFEELRSDVIPLLNMVLKMGEAIDLSTQMPEALVIIANGYINDFAIVIDSLIEFDIKQSKSNFNYSDRDKLIADTKKRVSGLLGALNVENKRDENFLVVYNAIMSFHQIDYANFKSLEASFEFFEEDLKKIMQPLDDKFLNLDISQKRFDDLISVLDQKAKEKSTEEYAKVFQDVAASNRCSSIIWLIVSILSCIAFLCFIKFENNFIEVDVTKGPTVTTLEYLKRLLIISFLIYCITFLIKQYSIKKHLETLNTHRQNTLNSYNLFLKSMTTADQDVKNALMVEVARAIYESGQTGYIGSKEENNSTSSIMEVTKFIKPTQ